MKKGLILISILIAALLQGYFLTSLLMVLAVPNLVLIGVSLVAVQTSLKRAVLIGAWGGWWLDVIGLSNFGLRSVWMMSWAAGLWWLRRAGIEFERPIILVASVTIGSLIYNLSLWLGTAAEVGHWLWSGQLATIWLWEAATTGGLAWLVGRRLQRSWGLASTRRI